MFGVLLITSNAYYDATIATTTAIDSTIGSTIGIDVGIDSSPHQDQSQTQIIKPATKSGSGNSLLDGLSNFRLVKTATYDGRQQQQQQQQQQQIASTTANSKTKSNKNHHKNHHKNHNHHNHHSVFHRNPNDGETNDDPDHENEMITSTTTAEITDDKTIQGKNKNKSKSKNKRNKSTHGFHVNNASLFHNNDNLNHNEKEKKKKKTRKNSNDDNDDDNEEMSNTRSKKKRKKINSYSIKTHIEWVNKEKNQHNRKEQEDLEELNDSGEDKPRNHASSLIPPVNWHQRQHHLRRDIGNDDEDDIENENEENDKKNRLYQQQLVQFENVAIDSQNANKKNAIKNGAIRDPIMEPYPNSTSLPITPAVDNLGLLLDAGRHYFPERWLFTMIDLLSRLKFNLLHFRLTDDQAFNIRLDSHPELANPAYKSDGKIYTPQFLRTLVQYASDRGVRIMPEINIPGHAGSWAGKIPNIVVPCAQFICQKGYGIPLNITHPGLSQILEDVLREIRSIFHTSPYIHLGGDEVHMSSPCFHEVGIEMYNYNIFEAELRNILARVGIPESNVVRWQTTGQANVTDRVGGVDHFWMNRDYVKVLPKPNPPLFVSGGLYFDTNGVDDAFTIFDKTKLYLEVESYKPTAIIVGTFELGTKFWMDRNVVGRLVAVSMGAANETYDEFAMFGRQYYEYCMLVGLGHDICEKQGVPLTSMFTYQDNWRYTHESWRSMLCQRLTHQSEKLEMTGAQRFQYMGLDRSLEYFWNTFDRKIDYFSEKYTIEYNTSTVNRKKELKKLRTHSPKYTGIIIDLIEDGSYSELKITRIMAIIDYLSQLGFNLLQLRVMSDYGFSVSLHKNRYSFGTLGSYFMGYTMPSIRAIIKHATLRGMEVMPEISITTRAGGWHNAVPLLACPNYYCETFRGLSVNTSDASILPVVLAVVKELQSDFTSPYIHFGYDERNESQACYDEAKMVPRFDVLERKIERLLGFHGVDMKKVLRWQNAENKRYPKRAGKVTHYLVSDPKPEPGEEFFMTNDLMLHNTESKHTNAWDLYEYVQSMVKFKPTGILAWVGSIRDESLKALNMRQRLLAVSIGLSHDGLNYEEFSDVFNSTCHAVNNRQCEKFGKFRHTESVLVFQARSLNTQRETSCRIRTRKVTITNPISGVLVPRDNNVTVE